MKPYHWRWRGRSPSVLERVEGAVLLPVVAIVVLERVESVVLGLKCHAYA